jgi:hypothetical protein
VDVIDIGEAGRRPNESACPHAQDFARISPCVTALSGFDWSVRKFSGPEFFSSVSRRGFQTGAAFIGEDEERSFLKRNGILGWIM